MFDGRVGLQPLLPITECRSGTDGKPVPGVEGLQDLLQSLMLPEAVGKAMLNDLEMLGAISVKELTAEDWKSLPAWCSLRTLQQRLLLTYVGLFWVLSLRHGPVRRARQC